MTRPWKVIVASVVFYQIILTWGFLRLAGYSIWLHFDCSNPENNCHHWPLFKTSPGTSVFWWIIVTAIVLVVINAIVIVRHASAKQPGKGQSEQNVQGNAS
jgi:hypothetical protein